MKFCLYALTRKKWNNAFDVLKEIISNLESYVQPIFQLNIKIMFRHVGNWNLYLWRLPVSASSLEMYMSKIKENMKEEKSGSNPSG